MDESMADFFFFFFNVHQTLSLKINQQKSASKKKIIKMPPPPFPPANGSEFSYRSARSLTTSRIGVLTRQHRYNAVTVNYVRKLSIVDVREQRRRKHSQPTRMCKSGDYVKITAGEEHEEE